MNRRTPIPPDQQPWTRRWAIFFLATALFVISQFYRMSVAVISPDLIKDLSLDTRGLSLATSAFFYAFAVTQIPIGICLDRIGPRKTMTVLNLIGITGAMVFALADSINGLVAGRILLGIGMACNLMGTFKLLTLWFGPRYFATLSVVVVSIGTAGNLVAATPLVLLVQYTGWRNAFLLFSLISLVLVIAFVTVVRDRPEAQATRLNGPVPSQSFKDIFSGLFRLFAMRDYWIISMGTFCHYGIFAAIQALWAGPYLMQMMGLSPVTAGNLIFLLSIGIIAGGPFWGILSDRWLKTRKRVVIIGIAGLGLCLAALAFLPSGAAIWIPAVLFLSMGLLRSAGVVMYAHIKDLMPAELAGTAMTGINFFTMVGPAVFVQLMGALMQHFYPHASLSPAAFRTAFLFCAASLSGIFILYFFTRERINRAPV